MQPKPKHWQTEYSAWFQGAGIVAAYPNRPPYPLETFAILTGLMAADAPRVVLDVGSGTGDLARRLASLVERVDAVDLSAGMIETGKRLPGGDDPHIRWIHAAAEQAPLAPPYALITAGESIHWMAWDALMPRLAAVLAPGGALAIVERNWEGPPALWARMAPLFLRYSANKAFQPSDIIAELEGRGLFRKTGEQRTAPAPWRPTVAEYIACRHSQNGFSRERMAPGEADAFDAAIREAVRETVVEGTIVERDGRLELAVTAMVVWGEPLALES